MVAYTAIPGAIIVAGTSNAQTSKPLVARGSLVGRDLPNSREDAVNVKSFGAMGDSNEIGSEGTDDTAAIQTALDYLRRFGGGTLYFPAGNYKLTSYLSFPANVIFKGAGRKCSKLVGTHRGGGGADGSERARNGSILANVQPVNTSTRIDCTIEDLWLHNSNYENQGVGIYQRSGVVLTIRNCEITGCKWGVILDQSEDVLIEACELGSNVPGGAALWIVNGPDLSADALGNFSNIITVRDCMLNVTTRSRGVVDDGGVAHNYEGCNFVCGINGLRASDVVGLTLVGNYFEAQTGDCILLASTALNGRQVGGSTTTIIGGYATAPKGFASINGSGSPGTITIIGGHYNGGGGKSPLTNASTFFQIYLPAAPGNGTEVQFADGIAGGGGTHVNLSKVAIDNSGNMKVAGLTLSPPHSATPASNGQMTFELTSDTSLKIKVKGKDGTIRTATLPLTA